MKPSCFLLICLLASTTCFGQHYQIAPDTGEIWTFKHHKRSHIAFLKRAEVNPGSNDTARMQSEISYRRHPASVGPIDHIGYVFGDTYLGHMVVQQGPHIELHYQNYLIEFDLNRSQSTSYSSKDTFRVDAQPTQWVAISPGVFDSVKAFKIYHSSQRDSGYFESQLKISKNHGLIAFPSELALKRDAYTRAFKPGNFRRVDFTRPPLSAYFDYQVGDELHYRSSYAASPPIHVPFYYENHYCIARDYDSLVDTMTYRWRVVSGRDSSNIDTSYRTMVIPHFSKPAPVSYHFDSLRFVPSFMIPGSSGLWPGTVLEWRAGNGPSLDSVSLNVTVRARQWYRGDSIFGVGLWTGHYGRYHLRYKVGLDTLVDYDYNGYASSGSFLILIYHKIGNRQRGQPHYVGEKEFPRQSPALAVYPNPAQETLRVNFRVADPPEKFNLRDASGRFIRAVSLKDGSKLLNIAQLPSGLYWLESGRHRARFIKE